MIDRHRRAYRPDIDGIRAIAVTSVVFFHAGLFPFRSGFVGVDIFFVLSGYLVGGVVLHDLAQGRFSFKQFYARRARRILPALFLVVLSTCAIGYALFDASEFKDVGTLGTMALLGASNINFWQFQDYFARDASARTLLMTWSLGVEEQFYLVLPFILMTILKIAPRRLFTLVAIVSAASFAVSLWWTWRSPAAAFYLLPSRAWELGAGVLTVMFETRRGDDAGRSRRGREVLSALGLVILIVAIVGFDDTIPFPGWFALLPVLGTVALLASPESVINRRLLGAAPMVFVGLVSYSWYLWHWPLMSALRIIVPSPVPTPILVGVAVVSFGVAVLSWRFVEQPFRQVRHTPGVTLIGYALAMVLVIAVPITIQAAKGLPSRLDTTARTIEAIGQDLRASHCLVSSGARLSGAPGCSSAEPEQHIAALLGDSHAWALQPGLRAAAGRQGYGFKILARASCPPLLGVTVRSAVYPNLEKECIDYNEAALASIVGDPRVSVVMLAGFWNAPVRQSVDSAYVATNGPQKPGLALLEDGLRAMIGAMTRAGKRVILVDDVPSWRFDPLRLALADAIPARRLIAGLFDPDLSGLRRGWVPSNEVARHDDVRSVLAKVAVEEVAVKRLDLYPVFCSDGRCVFNDDGPLYFDKDHLSSTGAIRALAHLDLGE